MNIFGITGWKNSGKTTLTEKLVAELVLRGWKVSTVKHAHHDFDIDKPGADSFRHRQAGATEVAIVSGNRWALMHELRGAPEPSLATLIGKIEPVDLLLIEGFKQEHHAKLEVHRAANGKPFMFPDDPNIKALVSDAPVAEGLFRQRLPYAHLDDVSAVADLVLKYAAPFQMLSGVSKS